MERGVREVRRDALMAAVVAEAERQVAHAESVSGVLAERLSKMEPLAYRRLPMVRNLEGWRWLVVAGPFVFGVRRRRG